MNLHRFNLARRMTGQYFFFNSVLCAFFLIIYSKDVEEKVSEPHRYSVIMSLREKVIRRDSYQIKRIGIGSANWLPSEWNVAI